MGLAHYKIQLASIKAGRNDNTAGGKCYVAQTGDTTKQALFNKDGSTMANPFVPVNGLLEFYTADTVAKVDLYGQAGTGHAYNEKNVSPSGQNEIYLEYNQRKTTLIIPYSFADTAANTETDTGFALPKNSVTQPMEGGVDILTIMAAKTLSVGILSSQANGNATGFFSSLSTAVAGAVVPAATIAAGLLTANTYGAFLADYVVGTNTDDRGIFNRKEYVCDGVATNVSYTLAAATTAGKGFIKIPYTIPNV